MSFEAAVAEWLMLWTGTNSLHGSNPVPIETFANYGRIDNL